MLNKTNKVSTKQTIQNITARKDPIMVFGLGSKKVDKATKSSSKSSKKSSGRSQADEAAAILKKMEEKKQGDECAFC